MAWHVLFCIGFQGNFAACTPVQDTQEPLGLKEMDTFGSVSRLNIIMQGQVLTS